MAGVYRIDRKNNMKVTNANYRYFQSRVIYWQKELGCLDWSIHFANKPLNDEFARTDMHNEAGVATIMLATVFPSDCLTDHQLNKTAFHEVLHLLFSNLITEAKARYANEYDIDRAEHRLIRVLENLLVKE